MSLNTLTQDNINGIHKDKNDKNLGRNKLVKGITYIHWLLNWPLICPISYQPVIVFSVIYC